MKIRFAQYLQLERSLSGNSLEAYLDDVSKLERFTGNLPGKPGPEDLSASQLGDFSAYLSAVGLAPSSQSRVISGIKAFYKFLVLENEIAASPAELLEAPRAGRKLPDFLNVDEIMGMLAAADRSTPEGERNSTIIEVLYGCGLRVSELTALRISDLHINEEYLKVTGKGNKERLVPLGRPAIKSLQNYLQYVRPGIPVKKEHADFVFLNRRGTKLSRVMVFYIIGRWLKKQGSGKN